MRTNKNDFLLSSLAHDIKSYLAVVEAINISFDKSVLTDDQTYLLDLLDMTNKSIMSLVNNTLSLSKLQNDSLEVNHEDFNLKLELENIIKMFDFTMTQKNVELNMTTRRLPEILNGDLTKIKQVFINLISNSIKFTHSGSIKCYAECESVVDGTANILCSVTDTGIGIDDNKLLHIFESHKTYDPSEGTGLGLYITKQFVNLMGGNISVNSIVNCGTTFEFNMKLDLP